MFLLYNFKVKVKVLPFPSVLLTKISIISNLRLLIENHKGIKLYTEKEIIVKCKKFNIEISGSELFIREITDEYIYIFGIVENIKYSMWE